MHKFLHLYFTLALLLSIQFVKAQDFQAPSALCLENAIVNTQESMVTIAAKDLDAGSFDNLSFKKDLSFTFNPTPPSEDPDYDENSKSSTANFDPSLGQVIVDMYVWDEAGNSDFCSVLIQFQNNSNASATVEGTVNYYSAYGGSSNDYLFDQNTEMQLENIFDPNQDIQQDFPNGEFAFGGLTAGSYRLKGYSNSAGINGVSTLDLVLIKKQILQLGNLEDPYSKFAADVYQDDVINALDIIQLRPLILGVYVELPNNRNWRFGDSEQVFMDPDHPLREGLKETHYLNLDGNQEVKDFIAIKTGDVNHTFARNLNDDELLEEMLVQDPSLKVLVDELHTPLNMVFRSTTAGDTVIVSIEESLAEPGDALCIPVTVENFQQVAGFQFPFSWDPEELAFNGIQNTFRQGFNYNEEHTEDGQLLMIWIEQNLSLVDLEDGAVLFELCFDVLGNDSQYTDISFDSSFDFEPGVFNFDQALPLRLNGGQVANDQGCVEYMQVALGINGATVEAEAFYVDEGPDDLVLVNGESEITFTCEDLGENTVNVSIQFANGNIENCSTTVNVRDLLSPVAIVEEEINVTLNENLQYQLNPEEVLDGSFDNCSEIEASVSPEVLDCNTPNPVMVSVTVMDASGNSSEAYTLVNIEYPEHPGITLTCKNETDIVIPPGESVELTAEMLLEGAMTCNGYYELEIYTDNNSNQPQDDLLLSMEDVGNTYLAVVTDPVNDNSCWTEINIFEGSSDAVILSFPFETIGPNEEICIPLRVYNFNKIGGFQFPISWDSEILQLNELVIPDDCPLGLNLNSNFNIFDDEIWMAWFDPAVTGVDMEDGEAILELCFTTIGPYESWSPITFYSESGFLQTEVINADGEEVNYALEPGEVFIYGAGCVSSYPLSLDPFGHAELNAQDLFYSEVPYESVTFANGENTLSFSCDDLGSNYVEIIITYQATENESCEVEVIVEDQTAPVAIANESLVVELNENFEFLLSPDLIDDGSYDLCSGVELSVSPAHLDCSSPNPAMVVLTATDEAGNQNQSVTEVNILYPDHPGLSIACNGDVNVSVTPNTTVTLTADMFLEGNQTCPAYYDLFAFENNDTQQPLDDLVMDYTDGGNTYLVMVQDPISELACWSYVHIILQDCSDVLDESSIGWPCDFSLMSCGVEANELTPGTLVQDFNIDPACVEPQLDLLDCQVVGVSYEDSVFEFGDSSKLIRHWTVIDWLYYDPLTEEGLFDFEQEIIIHQIDADALVICDTEAWNTPTGDCASGHTLDDMVEWPADIEVSSFEIHPMSLANNPNVHPNDVQPRLFANCVTFAVSFEDVVMNISDELTQVERTWKVVDWTHNTYYEFVQIISIQAPDETPVFCAYTPGGIPLAEVNYYEEYYSGTSGCVSIPGIPDNTLIEPSKEDDWQDGLDLMDLITLYKAILGEIQLTPYQMLAADINQSGTITTLDAVLLEGIYTGSIQMDGSPWKFVDADYVFSTIGLNMLPTQLPSSVVFESGSLGSSFIGIKLGDLNDSYETSAFLATLNSTTLEIKDEALFQANDYELQVSATENFILEGLKISFDFDDSVLEINDISSDVLGDLIIGENVTIKDSQIKIDFAVSALDLINNSGVTISKGQSLFSVHASAIDNGLLHSALSLSDQQLQLIKKQSLDSPEIISLDWMDFISDTKSIAQDQGIVFFPQPADQFIKIRSTLDLNKPNALIFNSFGQIIKQEVILDDQINTTDLESGIYMLQVVDNGKLLGQQKVLILR